MAHMAKDGMKFGARVPMEHHNRSMEMGAKKSAAGGVGTMDPLKGPEMDDQGMGQEDGAAVAAEHGPASEVHMMHDEAAGRHEVHSMHPDGHTHMSEHGSKEEAHEHGKKLAGIGGEEEHEPMGEEEESPEYE